MTYWHGGGRIAGDWVEPAEVTGRSRSADVGVHVTTDRSLAEMYASTVDEATAWVYEVEPEGPVAVVAPAVAGRPVVSYRCARARIVRRFTVSAEVRARARRAVAEAQFLLGW